MKETKKNKKTENEKAPVLYLVVPCFNEEEVIEKSAGIMLKKLKESRLSRAIRLTKSSLAMQRMMQYSCTACPHIADMK